MKKQLSFSLSKGKKGGRRPGAGRPRKKSKGVAHDKREKLSRHTPLHINFKVRLHVKNKNGVKALRQAIANARKFIAVIHYSLQTNHVHLIIEARSNNELTRGMRSLTVTFAKLINAGRIQNERYHLHILKTMKEVRNATRYVIFNEARHSGRKWIIADITTSLHKLDLSKMAKQFRISIVKANISKEILTDNPVSYLMQGGLKPS